MAERIPRDQSLSRIYGAGALFSAGYGNVGSSIYYALGVTAAFALGLTPLAFMVAGLIFICTAATYAEATVMYPEAGGSSSFARHAFNELVSFIAAWGQMLNYTITVAISAYFVPHYLAAVVPALSEAPLDVGVAAAVIGGLALINVRGGQESARLNTVLAVADVATQMLLVLVGLFLVFNPEILVGNIEWGAAPTWGNFALGIAVGMIAYTGIETISNMSEEARDAARSVPRGVGLVVAVVLLLYLLIPVVALSAMPVSRGPDGSFVTQLGTTYADDPILGIVEGVGLPDGLTSILRVYVGILAGVILIVATNAGLIGVSRLSYSMGQHRQLPETVRRIHPRYRTPWVAIIVFAVIATITMLPGKVDFLATLYAFGAMLSFTIAHAAVLWLRKRLPEADRQWTPPLNFRLRGIRLPVTAVFGGIGTLAAWLVVMALNPVTLAIGMGWLATGIAGYVLYRRLHRLPVTRTVKLLLPEPLGVEEVEYRSVLVAVDAGRPLPEEVIATAAKLTSDRRHGIHIVALLTVPMHLPLGESMKREERNARHTIDQAKAIAGARISGQVARVRPGEAGYYIARRARATRAEAVVIGLPSRDGIPRYGRTLETVMRERPCRIIVVSEEAAGDGSWPRATRPKDEHRPSRKFPIRSGDLHQRTIRVTAVLFILVGFILAGMALGAGGGPTSTGALLGLAFIAVGAGRIALQRREGRGPGQPVEFHRILVPVFGTGIDDDIVSTAGTMAVEPAPGRRGEGAELIILHLTEVPLTRAIDDPLPSGAEDAARRATDRARDVAGEYEGVRVTVERLRVRRQGTGIVAAARRLGADAIVMGAEPPSPVRGGASLGGIGEYRPAEIGPVTAYVLRRAPCRVLLTAPPETERARDVEPLDHENSPATAGRA